MPPRERGCESNPISTACLLACFLRRVLAHPHHHPSYDIASCSRHHLPAIIHDCDQLGRHFNREAIPGPQLPPRRALKSAAASFDSHSIYRASLLPIPHAHADLLHACLACNLLPLQSSAAHLNCPAYTHQAKHSMSPPANAGADGGPGGSAAGPSSAPALSSTSTSGPSQQQQQQQQQQRKRGHTSSPDTDAKDKRVRADGGSTSSPSGAKSGNTDRLWGEEASK